MTPRGTWALLIHASCIFLAGCSTTATSEPKAPAATSLSVAPIAAGYPFRYAVLSEAELHAREKAAADRNPGWTILLDPFGLLSSATLSDTSSPPDPRATFSDGDRARADAFLNANRDIVGGDFSAMSRLDGRADRPLYQQKIGDHVLAWLAVERKAQGLEIQGHFWPGWDPKSIREKPEDELSAALAKADPEAGDGTAKSGVRLQASSAAGPIEIHLARCHEWPKIGFDSPPEHPCVDTVTGETLGAHGGVTTRVSTRSTTHTKNGVAKTTQEPSKHEVIVAP